MRDGKRFLSGGCFMLCDGLVEGSSLKEGCAALRVIIGGRMTGSGQSRRDAAGSFPGDQNLPDVTASDQT